MKIKEIIVVEGKDDSVRIKMAVEADTIETNGSALDEATILQVEKAQASRGVIVLTDPDFPGGKIRETLTQRIPGIKHAFIRKQDCQSPVGGSLGVEHASVAVIRQALENIQTPYLNAPTENLKPFFLEAGLLGQPHSAIYREKLGDELGIGHTNGKQFVKKVHMFQITKQEIIAAMEKIGLPIPTAQGQELV
ncbi:ribonuclease M5 [Jeotgalibaca sp. A122]|uniref:ribonuclease M5 n=1 Tax=Jeotgalibaca sp. A122 TaxID=3457322 RepID=UPI003FD4D2E4